MYLAYLSPRIHELQVKLEKGKHRDNLRGLHGNITRLPELHSARVIAAWQLPGGFCCGDNRIRIRIHVSST